MADYAVAVAFIAFCAFASRTLMLRSKEALTRYRASIMNQFDEAEHLLNEAKELFQRATEEKRSMAIKIHEIEVLAQAEMHFILESSHKKIEGMKEAQRQIYHQHVETLRHEWRKEMMEHALKMLRHGVQDSLRHSGGKQALFFLQSHVSKTLSPPSRSDGRTL
jgi:F0F1-type ATP synthase membrane subunit b/b'